MKKIIKDKRIFRITFLSTFLYLAISFLSNFGSSLPSEIIIIYYLFSLFLIPVLLIIGLFSLLAILIKKPKGKPKDGFINFGVSCLFSLIVLIPIVIFINRYIPDELPTGSDKMKFDSRIWQSDSSSKWNGGISLREQMLKDVLMNILPGKSKQEIENTLGPSLETKYFQRIDKDFIYFLGPERDGFLNLDSEWLLIWLDERGKFKSYEILID